MSITIPAGVQIFRFGKPVSKSEDLDSKLDGRKTLAGKTSPPVKIR